MKILITGATGFVGRNLIGFLDKYEVYILSRKNIPEKNAFVGDLSDKKVLIEACKADCVIHLAGASDGNVLKVNYEGTKNLVDACVENKVKKFIFVSSYDAVLDTKYGKSKLKAEEYLKNSGLNYLIFKPTVIYGKENKKDIGKLINMIKKFNFAPVPGDGTMKLQPLFVEDFAKVLAQSIKINRNKIYFISGKDVMSFNEIADAIAKRFSRKIVKIHIPKFITRIINKNLLFDKICDNKEIEKDFKIKLIGFREGINIIS